MFKYLSDLQVKSIQEQVSCVDLISKFGDLPNLFYRLRGQ